MIGAVVLSDDANITGLNDSKKLSASKRTQLDLEIREKALGFGLGWVHAHELDEVGLSAALRLATIRAVEQIMVPYHEIIIDGTINFLSETTKGKYVSTMPKADGLIPAVSAASIIAKVARDTYMEEQGALYPQYGFESHVGYGTARHRQALEQFGVTSQHRRSFAPIKKLIEGSDGLVAVTVKTEDPVVAAQTSTQIGNAAESRVAEYLEAHGYAIIARNWKTKQCEVDCIAKKDDTYAIVEVKFRKTARQGGGVAAITNAKLRKLQLAAELFMTKHPEVTTIQLLVASITGSEGPIELIQVEF